MNKTPLEAFSDGVLLPTALYGVVLLAAAIAYELLQHSIIKHHGSDYVLAEAVGKDWKGKIS